MQIWVSFRFEGWHFLIIRIGPDLFVLHFLLLLSSTGSICNCTLLLLQFTVGENLLSTQVFLLHGPESLFFLLGFLQHFCLLKLKSSLVHDLLLLFLTESLEVVWLDTVWGSMDCSVFGSSVIKSWPKVKFYS